jgi:hypothetical protein
LPSGLKVKKDKTTGEWFVTGKPKKVGTWNAIIKVTAKSGAVEQLPVTITVEKAETLPAWVVGTFEGYFKFKYDTRINSGSVSFWIPLSLEVVYVA